MNIRTNITKAAAASAIALSVFSGASVAFAQTTTTATSTATSSKAEARQAALAAKKSAAVTKAISRADQEITRRITALNELTTRIGQIKKVSDADKASIAATVQSEIASLTALKAKIDADTDAATLKTDVKSITDSYRIFALVIPQGHLLAAVDAVNATADSLTSLSTKLAARLASSTVAQTGTSTAATLLADMNAKIADARSLAAAAQTEFAGLKPDNGDKATMTANTAALKDARAKIKAATEDLKAARKEAQTIVDGFKAGKRGNATSTAAQEKNQ